MLAFRADFTYERTRSHGENKPATPIAMPLNNRAVINSESEGSLSAEQIVNRFAENAGVGLSDVISNYSLYALAIQQSFAHRGIFDCIFFHITRVMFKPDM